MQTVDVLIIVMAVVAVIGSAAGVTLYEPPTGGQEYAVTFSEGQEQELDPVDAGSQTGNGGDTLSAEVPIQQENVSSLAFRADISASGTAPVGGSTVTYTVVVLNATGGEVDRGTGTISATDSETSVRVDVLQGQVCSVPDDTTVEGSSLEDARENAADEHTCDDAMQNWTIQIEVSGDADGPLARTHSAEITPIITTYSATVTSDLPTSRTA